MTEDNKTVTAAMVIIGNEVLSGRTKDANLGFLGDELNQLGIRMMEARIVADIEAEIIDAVNSLRARYDYVFTTGGIG
ncbi:MAG: competence/damage-inducible protein A, partial [Rhodospirillales bacterium]|nr:competence/damage-inducible protein A [Rhodospirillales bacterium]